MGKAFLLDFLSFVRVFVYCENGENETKNGANEISQF